MTDTVDLNSANPEVVLAAIVAATPTVEPVVAPVVEAVAVVAPVDFASSTLHSELLNHIETFGGFATARLHQILEEMRNLFAA